MGKKAGQTESHLAKNSRERDKGNGSHIERGGNGRSGQNLLEAKSGGLLLLADLRARRKRRRNSPAPKLGVLSFCAWSCAQGNTIFGFLSKNK